MFIFYQQEGQEKKVHDVEKTGCIVLFFHLENITTNFMNKNKITLKIWSRWLSIREPPVWCANGDLTMKPTIYYYKTVMTTSFVFVGGDKMSEQLHSKTEQIIFKNHKTIIILQLNFMFFFVAKGAL